LSEGIFLPGELEHLRMQERIETGIPLQAKIVKELWSIAEELGIPATL